jgi:hypothetical protein
LLFKKERLDMKLRKVFVVALLGLSLVLGQAGLTSPAILERASQLLNLNNVLANPITLSAMKQRLPSGGTVAYTLPSGQAFLLTKTSWHITASDLTLSGDVLMTIGNYYQIRLTMVNGIVGSSDNLLPGIPIADFSQKISVCMFGDASKTPITGTISIRLLGYTAPNN